MCVFYNVAGLLAVTLMSCEGDVVCLQPDVCFVLCKKVFAFFLIYASETIIVVSYIYKRFSCLTKTVSNLNFLSSQSLFYAIIYKQM